ncbi:MAG: DNA polymerase III epsilon subunit (EC [uncultured Sulfurovum sp.]|uniref:DNA polymerase III epsilon subunit (EC) n=1 Tax=uncultured Sulfurovum sp. TaxID=269237 RepID=A0A6S6TEE1_9BACT|nr:MAG: DNA polymerase III epsilon subunit (EC [uncultured Sulfurovum sp.]
MQKVFEELTIAFRKYNGVLCQETYQDIAEKHCTLLEDSDTILILLQASGYPIVEAEDGYRLLTYFTPYHEQKYCVIDIETNGSKPGTSQVIEIGAVMLQNGKVIDSYETFVECAFLPEYITKITGIEPTDLIDAPSRKEALTGLRHFMQDSIFVAHNANFDYSFLNASFERFGLGNIGNPKLCTIDLARRTFESERYGLAYLIDFLEIETATHHRAYSDAVCAAKVMEKSVKTLPQYVLTADELLRFSISSKKERRLKKEKED